MKNIKKILSVILATTFIASCFAGCSGSSSDKAENPMIIGYYANDPFITFDDKGNVSGFDKDVVEYACKNYVTSTDYDGYKFVEVKESDDIQLGEEGQPVILIGGVKKNTDNVNEKYRWTDPIVVNSTVSLVAKDSKIKSYSDFSGATVVCVGDSSQTALNKNANIAKSCKSINTVKTLDEALNLLNGGKADAIVVDEFTYKTNDTANSLTVLDGVLAKDEYAFAIVDWEWFQQDVNYAVYKMLDDPDKGDVLTPMAEKAFGYNAINLDKANAPAARD